MHLIYCRRHIASKRHTDYVALHKTSKPISNFFARRNEKDEKTMKVTKAETIMSGMLAEMNIPMSAADTFSRAMKVMFPDSEIAQKFQCGRSKATALVKELSHAARQDLLTNMRMMPFTVSTDGSNDDGSGNK